ncbi:Thioredoxin [Popillia japonica]|uniref:Thioredoxin n=1 Tax=Popillia japonica TaxID=7064 RepID=A0AAW1IWN2_POPJA
MYEILKGRGGSDEILDLVEDPVDSEIDGTLKDDSASNNVASDESNKASGSNNCSEGGPPSSSFLIKNRPVRNRKSPDRLSLISIAVGKPFSESSNTISSREKGNGLEQSSDQSSDFTDLEQDTFYNYTEKGNHFVKFFAPWCPHSIRLEPTWKNLAETSEFEDKIKFSRVDCEENGKLCENYNIREVPTLIWIKNGKKVKKYTGERDYASITSFIRKRLGQEKLIVKALLN